MKKFSDLPLTQSMVQALGSLGFTEPTAIQAEAIPTLINKVDEVDFLGQAQTGTGKTFAFGIPLIEAIDTSKRDVQALIVAPTRELVNQIAERLDPLMRQLNVAHATVYGGTSFEMQVKRIKNRAQLIIGTPGRLNDHLRRRTLNLSNLKVIVLDEADIMLDMGFKPEIEQILSHTPATRRIWLFSATNKPAVEEVIRQSMNNVVRVSVTPNQVATTTVKQYYCIAPARDRLQALWRLVEVNPDLYGIVFCPTKILCADVANKLANSGYAVAALHGDMSQQQREHVVRRFRDKRVRLLIATDIAARGIDVADLTHVINLGLPDDLESYVHRVGRTGRAGKEGTAITLIRPGELRRVHVIQRRFGVTLDPMNIPSISEVFRARVKHVEVFVNGIENKNTGSEQEKLLGELVSGIDRNKLEGALVSMLRDKFFALSQLQGNVEFSPTGNYQSKGHSDESSEELIIFAGLDDGISKSELIQILQEKLPENHNGLHNLRVLRRRSFLKMPHSEAEGILKVIQGVRVSGKRIRATLGFDVRSGNGSGSGRRSNGRSSNRSHGRFNGSAHRSNSGFRRGSRSNASYR